MSINTQSLVSTIKDDYAPDFSRTAILEYLNRAQNALFNQDASQMIWLNKDDPAFPIPILQTAAGTLEYEISETNLRDSAGNHVSLQWGGYPVVPRKINKVFIEAADLAKYSKQFVGATFGWCAENPYWSSRFSRMHFYEIPGIPYDRSGLRGCRWQFAEDPSTTTDVYYVEFYIGPVELTAETVPLSIDGDIWQQALIDGVVGFVEDAQNGQSRRLERFLTYWKPRFRMSMQAGRSRRRPLQMIARECG